MDFGRARQVILLIIPHARRVLRAIYRLAPRKLRRSGLAYALSALAPKPSGNPVSPGAGVIVVGELSRSNGVGVASRLVVDTARRSGIQVWEVDVSGIVPGGPVGLGASTFDISHVPVNVPVVLMVNPPILPLVLLRLPRNFLSDRRVIGFWVWELPRLPPIWKNGLRFVHEIWAPTDFVIETLKREFDGPIRKVVYPVSDGFPRYVQPNREKFGLPAHSFVVMNAFSLASSLSRKNPLAAVRAFREAFGDRTDRLLLLKVSHHESFLTEFAQLQGAVKDYPNVVIRTEIWSRADSLEMMACCDTFLSLHRSEGFGLLVAEAMLLGVPVVVTDWSGTRDFVNSSTGVPIDYTLVPAIDDRGVYQFQGAEWAEPNIEQAAAALTELASNGRARQMLAEAARTAAEDNLGASSLLRALDGLCNADTTEHAKA